MLVAVGAASLAATVVLLFRDWSDYRYTKKIAALGKQEREGVNSPQQFESIKIVLTGGPCGGKSQGINCIYRTLRQIAAPVLIVPQAATIIGSAGLSLDLSRFKPRQIELFQIYLMRLQYNLEENVQHLARNLEKVEKTPIILCDRGLMDGKAYAGDQNFAKMLQQIGITEKQILRRYKAVVHMVTAAKGAEESYNYTTEQEIKPDSGDQVEGLKVRRESPQVAIDLDHKLQNCYKKHPSHWIVANSFLVTDFEVKKVILLAQITQIISHILKNADLMEYYSVFRMGSRKRSEDDIQLMDNPSPYLIRKRKFQYFLHQQQNRSAVKRIPNK